MDHGKNHKMPMKMMTAKVMTSHMNPPPSQKKIGAKISKIMHEGIRGKKVSQKQAVAVAINMAKRRKY